MRKGIDCRGIEWIERTLTKNMDNISKQKFGKLTALFPVYTKIKTRKAYWMCDCDCGNIHYTSVSRLNAGQVYSCGCTKSIGEAKIREILDQNSIFYVYNKPYFDDLVNIDGNRLKYDFILINESNSSYRIIEFDGVQHYKPIDFFEGQDAFDRQKAHDEIKNQYVLSHNIPLVRIPYSKRNDITFENLLGDQYLI